MESVVSSHATVAEVSCIGVEDEIKGEVPIVIIVLKEGIEGTEALAQEIKTLIRDKIGPVATPKGVHFAKALPKTRSGKVIRRAIKSIAEGKDPGDLSTIEDPTTIDKIRDILKDY